MTEQTIDARSMMTQNLVTLSPDMDVLKAIQVLLRKRISGAPVVATDGTFIGIFSERSAMQVIVNAAYDNLPDAGLMPFVDCEPPTITPETDLLTICQTFLNQETRRLPVIEDGRLLGQISRKDVMKQVIGMSQTRKRNQAETLYLSALVDGEQRLASNFG